MATATAKRTQMTWINGTTAAARAGVGVPTLRKLVEEGRLSYRRIGAQGRHQFVAEEIEELVRVSTRSRQTT